MCLSAWTSFAAVMRRSLLTNKEGFGSPIVTPMVARRFASSRPAQTLHEGMTGVHIRQRGRLAEGGNDGSI